MRLLIVDLQDPSESRYYSPKTIGFWFWGKSISRYKLFVVDKEGAMIKIVLNEADANAIQNTVNNAFVIARMRCVHEKR